MRTPDSPSDALTSVEASPLATALLGEAARGQPLPPTLDVLGALVTLAEGRRAKIQLLLADVSAELVLVRRGQDVLVSYLRAEEEERRDPAEPAGPRPSERRLRPIVSLRPVHLGVPVRLGIPVLDRRVPLAAALAAAAAEGEREATALADPTVRDVVLRLCRQARDGVRPAVAPESPVRVVGGRTDASGVPLAFGYEVHVVPNRAGSGGPGAHSDLHALLVPGTLWAWARGRRVVLVRGSIMVAVERMVAAVRALLEAWEQGRGIHVRLRAGSFAVGLRHRCDEPRGVELALRSDDAGLLTLPGLTVGEAGLPVLRVASELLRSLVDLDRSQARNLRVTDLRDEVRSLRRRLRRRAERDRSILHTDPESLRASSPPSPPSVRAEAEPRALRYEPRWTSEVAALDERSTFLCGDRLLIGGPRETLALGRDDGRVLWHRPHALASVAMAGPVLVRLAPEGAVDLCDPRDGEAFASLKTGPRGGGPTALSLGGPKVPPVLVLTEQPENLVGIDLRTGEVRWRVRAGGPRVALGKAGRILLLVAEGVLEALDSATGELLWRFSGRSLRPEEPGVVGDTVAVLGGDGARAADRLYGVDVYSGAPRWERRLEGMATAGPLGAGDRVLLPYRGDEEARLCALSADGGEPVWDRLDPGFVLGAVALPVDDALLVHGPHGGLDAIGLADGATRWSRRLAHPVDDDIPRRLEPVLRGGALFVPSAQVHALRPANGGPLGEPLPCDLIPDWLRVDERGWVYVAEESGRLAALAPRAFLRLVR